MFFKKQTSFCYTDCTKFNNNCYIYVLNVLKFEIQGGKVCTSLTKSSSIKCAY